MKRALFLGAGFSYDFYMPLVSELTNEFRKHITREKLTIYNQGWKFQGGGFSDESVQKIGKIISQDINYEQMVGAIEVEVGRFKNRHIYQDLHGLRQFILEIIWFLLCERHVLNASFLKESVRFHRGFRSLLNESIPTWVFTLNHDLVVEMIAGELGISLKNGFDETNMIEIHPGNPPDLGQTIRFSRLRMDQKLPDNYPWRYHSHNTLHPEAGINLLKIHGSLDVFGFDDRKSYLCLNPKTRTVDGYIEALKLVQEADRGFQPRITNHVIGYDRNKTLQILQKSILSGAFKFTQRIGQVASEKNLLLFQGSLNYANELLIFGYGFGDAHINDIIRTWLEFTDERSIVIVDPKINEVPSFIGHLPSQVTFKKMSTIDYLSGLPGGELSTQELEKLRLRQSARGVSREDWVKNEIAKIIEKIPKPNSVDS